MTPGRARALLLCDTRFRPPATHFAVLALAALTTTACASSGATPSPFPKPRSPAATAHIPTVSLDRDGLHALLGTAMDLRGVPYRDGGADPRGFDCSGFVFFVFAQHGVILPRTVVEQYRAGSAVARSAVKPGDLVFFSTVAPGTSHVGIVVSPDEFVHAPTSSGSVRVESLSAPYWSTRFVGAKRLSR